MVRSPYGAIGPPYGGIRSLYGPLLLVSLSVEGLEPYYQGSGVSLMPFWGIIFGNCYSKLYSMKFLGEFIAVM